MRWKVVELPYVGGSVSMVIAVPFGEHSLADLAAEIDAKWLHDRFDQLDAVERWTAEYRRQLFRTVTHRT